MSRRCVDGRESSDGAGNSGMMTLLPDCSGAYIVALLFGRHLVSYLLLQVQIKVLLSLIRKSKPIFARRATRTSRSCATFAEKD